jgi:hypothetical protein
MMVVLYAPIALSERTPRKCDWRILSRGPVSRSMTRISCRVPAWSWPGGPGRAARAGLHDVAAEHVRPAGDCGANADLKIGCLAT